MRQARKVATKKRRTVNQEGKARGWPASEKQVFEPDVPRSPESVELGQAKDTEQNNRFVWVRVDKGEDSACECEV